MKRAWVAGIVAAAAAGLGSVAAVPAALVVDDFEGYTNNQQLSQGTGSATSPSSPWLRFGNGANGQITATAAAAALDGQHSGSIPLIWSSVTNATFRYGFGAATDLSGYASALVTIRSTNPGTATKVQLSFSDSVSNVSGETTYVTATPVLLTDTAQTLTFAIDPALMSRTGGSHSFASAIAGVYSIGFRFSNPSVQANESVIIDDFQLIPVPEPAGVGLMSACVAGLATRRRRRRGPVA